MKRAILASVILLVGLPDVGMAACAAPSAQVTGRPLSNLLTNNGADLGNTACAKSGGDEWQEEHHSGGVLWDYKLGDGNAVDPRVQVGQWVINADNTVTYTYTGGGSYTYTIWSNGGGSYSFCGGPVEIFATFVATTGTSRVCPP